MAIINEKVVMEYYLKLMKKDEIQFLKGKPETKKCIANGIDELQKSDDLHSKILNAKKLWKILFEASMGYIDPDKKGYDDLFEYFDDFVEFEELIFASDKFYRDHTLHSLWVYFLGEYLYNHKDYQVLFSGFNQNIRDTSRLYDSLESIKNNRMIREFYSFLSNVKKIILLGDSIRCVIALSHDLGYPLKIINKINKSIRKIIPHFSITKYGEFDFQFESVQQVYIQNLIEILSYNIEYHIDTGDLNYEEQIVIEKVQRLFNQISLVISEGNEPSNELINQLSTELSSFTAKDEYIVRRVMVGRGVCEKSIARYLRLASDFEKYMHGIMSCYLLMKKLNSFSNFDLSFSDPSNLPMDKIDFATIYSKSRILIAMADHTSDGFLIRKFDNYSAFLVLVDEIEEFSRISRANQFRQYVQELCKSDIRMEDDFLVIEFIFDNAEAEDLKPEIAFKGKCKRLASVFDIPNLADEVKIIFRCIGKLPWDENVYELKIESGKTPAIKINNRKKDIKEYLDSSEVFICD
ncbi:MAG: hypothetical protein ACTSPT_02940 [Candidatus Heimdallarchaeota archaeon]